MFTRIVVGIDGSRPAEVAAQVAFYFAARHTASVDLVSVIEELPRYVSAREEIARDTSEAEQYFQEVLGRLQEEGRRRGVVTISTVLTGHEVAQVLRYTTEIAADLLVIGYAGHSSVWESALGSTALQLLRRSPCSVLVVRSTSDAAESPAHLARIAVALDGSPLGWEAFAEALALERAWHHPLHVVSVVDAPPVTTLGTTSRTTGGLQTSSPGSAENDAWRTFLLSVQARATAQAAAASVPIEVHMRAGPVSDALVTSARELGVDLLILGATGHERPWARVTGGTAMKVVEEAPCTVLIVRPPIAAVTAASAMTPAPASAHPETPAVTALTMLLDRPVRLLPITSSDGTLVGVVTLGMVLRRANPRLAAILSHPVLTTNDLGARVQQEAAGLMVRDIMNPRPYTVRPDTPLEVAARYLTTHRITRAPVVDDAFHLVGLLGEREVILALLGLVDQHTEPGEPTDSAHPTTSPLSAKQIPVLTAQMSETPALPSCGELADRKVPVVPASAVMDEILAAIEASSAGVVLVVDGDGKLRGTIEAHVLLQELARADDTVSGGRLWQALVRSSGQVLRTLRGITPATPLTASRLAKPVTCVLPSEMPLTESLARLISNEAAGDVGVVVASDGRPEGILWRFQALRALVGG
jgi:nucleotide-binding universal stress UspA family protein/CBS domain-containing protein